jgi:magnesium chelatase family protein
MGNAVQRPSQEHILSSLSPYLAKGAFYLFASVSSATMAGIDGVPVTVEVDVAGGLPCLEIVGLADTSVREARHRVRSALHNTGAGLPPRRITVNLAPASLHKEGPQLDLGIAVGVLAASSQVPYGPRLREYCFLGELALDGSVRPVRGTLPMVLAAMEAGFRGAVVPSGNQGEVAFLTGMDLRAAESLADVTEFLRGNNDLQVVEATAGIGGATHGTAVDFADIRGQATAKRALEVACSGGHSLVLCGAPGSGKSMLAKAMPGILPQLSREESLVVTRIQSAAGILAPGQGLVTARPFRAPHHTVTASALVGGGANPRPGEVTLAHTGVLFLDELPLFPPSVLNALRQPLEDGVTVVTRSRATYRFPSRFVLAAAMNPCPCGYFGDEVRECTCTEYARKQYAARVSGPLWDRIDLFVEVNRVDAGDLSGASSESSMQVRERVEAARQRQLRRLGVAGLSCNAEMGPNEITTLLSMSSSGRKLMLEAFRRLGLSTRAYYRVQKVAASIADLEGSPRIEEEHIAEALSYRQRLVGDDT